MHISASHWILLQQHHRRGLPLEAGTRSNQTSAEDEVHIGKRETDTCSENKQAFIVTDRGLTSRRKLGREAGKNARIAVAVTPALALKD